ncbi:hypothetical protein K353_05857 [Kitasatospora sp. SolWspMP-SS2h]|uniref:hypothetical protein n=1 Tax=Kitasatospora sp. SolWspMP-SS2h TaxID=1305729 RepID=UPI000DBAC1E6|nr:hypothetical protein [Kitasatospora sp. SolWspMP-SS2h]RAJ32859.1 hypothetical protein K353_05857 [Kitasatospora sp. SolWspMP-SS2h]
MADVRPNQVLRALMQRAGLSAQDLATAVNEAEERRFKHEASITGRHVRRWLSGQTAQPHLHQLVGLMDVFHLQGDELGFTLSGRRSRELAGFRPGSTLLVETPAEEDHVLRRSFMIAATGNLLSVAFAPLPASGRIGASDVDRIRESIDRLHAVDDAYGGEQLADIAEQFVAQIEAAMGRCLYGPRVEKALYQVIGQLHASAGWFSFDSGDQARASRNFDSALRASLLANDRLLQARVWAYMSRQSWELGRATETVTIARAALDATRNARDHRLSALLHGRLALGHAASGQGAQCGTALARAETSLDRIGGEPADAWLAFVGPGEVLGTAAMAHMNLGQPDRAAHQEEQGMQLLAPEFRRNRFAKSIHLAECYLAADQVEQAVSMADTALDLYPSVNCPRWAVHLSQFREKVASVDLPVTTAFMERYDATIAS